ncbi:MAG: MBL fold metallo-hydrolase [Actinomycetota bacterium]
METPRPPATAEFGHVTAGGAAHEYPPSGSLRVRKISVGSFDNNVYVLTSGAEALVVDGADEPDRIRELAGEIAVTSIVQTHGHFDHVRALESLAASWGCPVYAHTGDAGRMPVPTSPLGEGDTLRVGDVEVSVLHTPGHTPGSLCFVADGFLFSGDTLFPGGPGNTEGDPMRFAQIMEQLESKLFALPDATRVCPGHGLDTFIGREREHLSVWQARGW